MSLVSTAAKEGSALIKWKILLLLLDFIDSSLIKSE